jgi:type I restriction enzyme S subunit
MIAVPPEWEVAQLGDIVSIEIGRTPSRANSRYWNGTQLWLTISDLIHGQHISSTKERITEEAVRACGIKIHEPGTLVLSFKLTIGKLAFLGSAMATNEAIAALKPLPPHRVDSRFLYHVLSAFNFDLHVDRAAKGRTLNKAKMVALLIPFPKSIDKQRQIAAILDEADSMRGKRERMLELADDFLRSAYAHLVGHKNPDFANWASYRIEELAAPHKGSLRTGPFGSDLRHSEFVNDGIAVLGIDNAVQNSFAWDERRYISEEKYQKLRRYRVFPGDVIVTIMGTTGRSAVVPDDIPEAVTTKHLATITCNQTKVVPEFLSFAIHSDPFLIRQIQRANKGAIMAGLNLGIIKSLVIHLPPYELQERFAETVEKTRAMKAVLSAPEKNGESLFESLSQRAFRGEL